MAAQIYEVPNLQDIICPNTVFYKKVLCKANPATVDFVQNCFHQQLMGTMRKPTREKCIEMLNDAYFTEDFENGYNQGEDAILVIMDVCTILDSTLDECVTKLKICIPYSTLKLFPLVMSIISRRSPQLEELVVTFCTIKPTPILAKMEVHPAIITSQSDFRLHSLTKLSLSYSLYNWNSGLKMCASPQVPLRAVDEPCQYILGAVAKLCPSLAKLDIFGFHVRKQDLFDLVIGEWNDSLFPTDSHQWSVDSTIKGLNVPSEFLTPLCFTLKRLLFNSDRDTDVPTPSVSMCTFVFRHLPHLEEFLRCADSVKVAKAFYKTEMIENKQAEFEEHCRHVADRIGRKRKLSGPFRFLPNGLLSLTLLNKVTIDDAHTSRPVAFLCPHLRNVTCILSSVSKSSPTISVDEIESIFKK